MYKLLPEVAREKVRREYLLRRAVVMVTAFIVVLIVTIVGLFPSYMLSKARQDEARERARLIGLAKPSGETEELDKWLSQINLKLKTLNPKLDQDRPSLLLTQVIEKKGSGIRITRFNWVKIEGKNELSVSGVARDRQSLLSFESRLNNSQLFSTVALPVSNLAKDRDISFEIKLTSKPQ